MKRRLFLPGLALALVLTGCSPVSAQPDATPAPEPKSQVGFYFDTVVTMTVYTDDESLLADVQKECQRYDQLLSKTAEDSDVWRINHSQGQRVAVSDETREILEKALEYSRLSDGAFDVTIEPCVALWDFSEDSDKTLPDEKALAQAAERVDWQQVDINEDGVLLPEGVTIDLGAIAKGYITDRIADFMRQRGVESGYLNFGGNVLTIGGKPNGEPWSIGIRDPKAPGGQDIIGAVKSRDMAVVTSGIYERGFDLDGVRYHHLLDPATGWPVQNELAGVTIVAEDAFDADALSTTVFNLGLEAGVDFVEQLEGVEAIFVTGEDDLIWTSGLEEQFTPMN